jgi:ELWxxDGT repeat protein
MKMRSCHWVVFANLLVATHVAQAEAPHLVRDIRTTAADPADSDPTWLGILGNQYLFAAQDEKSQGLWITNGDPTGTRLLRRFGAVGGASAKLGGRLFFLATDDVHGQQLWSTDGSTEGTWLHDELVPGPRWSAWKLIGVMGSQLVFIAKDADDVKFVLVTDGSAAGTLTISQTSGETQLIDGKLYFDHQGRLYSSDGSIGGTRVFADPLNVVAGSDCCGPRKYHKVGSQLFFESSLGLAVADDTTNTISLVKTSSGAQIYARQYAEELDGTLVFLGSDGSPDVSPVSAPMRLWRTDGTPGGTLPISPALTERLVSVDYQQVFGKIGDRIVYSMFAGYVEYSIRMQLWTWDGANLQHIKDIVEPHLPAQETGTPNVQLYEGPKIGNLIYFQMVPALNSQETWRTDGTPEGTFKTSLPVGRLGMAAGDDQVAYFSNDRGALCRYEAALDRTSVLVSGKGFSSSNILSPSHFLFGASDSTVGVEPWVSDGSGSGTQLLKNVARESGPSSSPTNFVSFGGLLAFIADGDSGGTQIWVSDGTESGTRVVSSVDTWQQRDQILVTLNGALYWIDDITGLKRLGSPDGVVETLADLERTSQKTAIMGGRLYFAAADNGQIGNELWSTDGTKAGTINVADIATVGESGGNRDSYPGEITASGNRIFFRATGSAAAQTNGSELWVTDGTAAGTRLVADIVPGPKSSVPFDLVAFTGGVFFSAEDEDHGRELWKSDGTADGTVLVADIAPGPVSSNATPIGMLNGKLLFRVRLQEETQLWTSDGTSAGTLRLGTLTIAPDARVFVNGNFAYFPVSDASGLEPWVSDGTAAGTHLLKDIEPAGSSDPEEFANFNGTTMFIAGDPVFGRQLWSTDGTTAGTVVVGSIPSAPIIRYVPPIVGYTPHDITGLGVGSKYFFIAADAATGMELYVTGADDPPPPSGGGSNPPPAGNHSGGGGGSLGPTELLVFLLIALASAAARQRTRRPERVVLLHSRRH